MAKLTKTCPVCQKPAEEIGHTILSSLGLRAINLKCGHGYTEKLLAKKNWELLESQFSAVPHKLYPFQGAGYEFARDSGFRCLIGDEPGLGKTIQALACLKFHADELMPCLIIVKSALKLQWMKQCLRWLGIEYQPQVISDSGEKPSKLYPIIITTYDLLWRIDKKEATAAARVEKQIRIELKLSDWDVIPEDRRAEIPAINNPFKNHGFKTLILDECQQIKNPESRRAQQVRNIAKDIPHIIAASGTPIKNHAGEYFTILNILRPEVFRTYKSYLDNYCDSYWSGRSYKIGGIRDIEYFKEKTSDFIIRRTREEVLPDLPKLERKFQECDFASSKIEAAYKKEQEEFEEFYNENEGSGDMEFYSNMLAKMSKLRHLAGLNKVPFLAEFIEDFILDTPKHRKLTVFVHHKDVGEMLTALLNQRFEKLRAEGIEINNPLQYVSDLDSAKRQEIISNFCNIENSRVLIGSTLAMGEGVDGLQEVCEDFILAERQWNPANEEQVEGRFQRISPSGKVVGSISGNYVLSTGTIDEYFTELVEKKRAIMAQTLDGKDMQWDQTSLMKELAETLARKGSDKWKLQ